MIIYVAFITSKTTQNGFLSGKITLNYLCVPLSVYPPISHTLQLFICLYVGVVVKYNECIFVPFFLVCSYQRNWRKKLFDELQHITSYVGKVLRFLPTISIRLDYLHRFRLNYHKIPILFFAALLSKVINFI